MLRSVLSRVPRVVSAVRACHSAQVGPSTTTTVLLSNMPATVVESDLEEAIKAINCRSVTLEPGCSLHFMDKAAAASAAELISAQLGYTVTTMQATVPGLLLQNLPVSLTAQLLSAKFSPLKPAAVSLSSTAPSTLMLRFSPEQALDAASVRAALESEGVQVSEIQRLSKPALFFRKIEHLKASSLENALKGNKGLERVQYVLSGKDNVPKLAVAYFSGEEAALKCLGEMHACTLDGKRLQVSYKEVTEPAVTVSNLPSNATQQELQALCAPVTIVRARLGLEGKASNTASQSARLVFGSPKDADLASRALNRRILRESKLSSQVEDQGDLGICITGDAGKEPCAVGVAAALGKAGIACKGVGARSNQSAVVSFGTVRESQRALEQFVGGEIKLDDEASSVGALVSSSLTTSPSYALEVTGMPADVPLSMVTGALTQFHMLRADRSALVKFRRHRDVVPGINALKQVDLGGGLGVGAAEGIGGFGGRLLVERYRPLQRQGDSQYDSEFSEYDVASPGSSAYSVQTDVDRFTLTAVLQDFMHLDPATRFKIAKEEFTRALFDARATGDLGRLFDETLTAPAKAEVRELFYRQGSKAKMSKKDVEDRLFELFVQREEMGRYTSDFKEIETLLGPADESQPFDWSQFDLDTERDLEKLSEEMARADQEAVDSLLRQATGRGGEKPPKAELVVKEEEKKVETRPGEIRDAEGNLWSACVLDTDMVQKTMPGNRVNSHRALVVVGNLRGAAGYGMGKGKTGQDAVAAACRAAMRNVTHLDLYDNYGLAHDLYGRHNNCHVYIKATPNAREMVASPFATEVLLRFGIASASVKIIGNRNPYSTVMALFNALKQHENIDEFAKDRGQRYLSLRWAHDQNL